MGRVDESFEVAVGEDRLKLILETAQEVPGSPRPGGAFRLEFLGPADPVLDQGIYKFEIGEDCFEIFIVAIGSQRARDPLRSRFLLKHWFSPPLSGRHNIAS